jgi:serine/threonine-protein kinase
MFVRLLLVTSLLVAVPLTAVVLSTLSQGTRIASRQIAKDLAAIAAAQQRVEAQGQYRLQLQTDYIAADRAVAEYLRAAAGDDLGLPSAGMDAQRASVRDLLGERQQSLGFGLGILTDHAGVVLARTDATEAFEERLSEDRFFQPILETLEPAVGYWRHAGGLYLVAASPVVLEGEAVGFLLLGDPVDATMARAVAELSGADVAYFLKRQGGAELLASSLDRTRTGALQEAFNVNAQALMAVFNRQPVEKITLNAGGEDWAGKLSPLSGFPDGAVLALSPVERSIAPFRELQLLSVAAAVLGLLLALAAAYFLSRWLLKPLRELGDATRRAAAGDYRTTLDRRGTDEIGQLSEAVDRLLSSLREKSEMERYVAGLARLLPETDGGANTTTLIEAAQVRTLALLGVELRALSAALPAGGDPLQPQAALRATALRLAQASQATILLQSGPILVFGVGGDRRLERVLALLDALLKEAFAPGGVGLAVVEGDVVSGALPGAPSERDSSGLPLLKLLRLLVEAPSGRVLLAPDLGATLGTLLGTAPAVVEGVLTRKRYYALDADQLARFRAVAEEIRDDAATRIIGPPGTQAPVSSTDTSMAILPGTRLSGRFEILTTLGAGGMGVVYKARDLELQEVVALKMLKPGLHLDAETLERLKSELKLARRITHPNVLRTFDFVELNGLPSLSMEFVRGVTLRYVLVQPEALPFAARLRIARQITAGLAAAHAVGVLHRDLKPENVIIEANGNAKLMDFGIARPIRRHDGPVTGPGMFVGTPGYAPPEALEGLEVDARADLYALGVMFCEIFCGRKPFAAQSGMELYLAQMQGELIAPRKLNPELPEVLEVLILRCLAHAPGGRPADAETVLDVLSQLHS